MLTNIKVMIPFCRTIEEGKKVLEVMKEHGLERHLNGLEIYVMAEIPSNILLAKKFAKIFDGFSIGSNDLTQLTLGIDRDSAIVSDLFNENNEAVLQLIGSLIRTAHAEGVKVGLCGQAPSDYPQFARFLVSCGIDSISFNPDALIRGIQNIADAEKDTKSHKILESSLYTE
jgi:pyruvate,water dikinase